MTVRTATTAIINNGRFSGSIQVEEAFQSALFLLFFLAPFSHQFVQCSSDEQQSSILFLSVLYTVSSVPVLVCLCFDERFCCWWRRSILIFKLGRERERKSNQSNANVCVFMQCLYLQKKREKVAQFCTRSVFGLVWFLFSLLRFLQHLHFKRQQDHYCFSSFTLFQVELFC